MKISKLIIWLTATALTGGLLGWLAVKDNGYIVISYEDYLIETTIWFILACLIISLIIVSVIRGIFSQSSKALNSLRSLPKKWRILKQQQNIKLGVTHLLLNDWNKAEQLFAQLSKTPSASPLANCAAAYAANQQKNTTQRDKYLEQATIENNKKESQQLISLIRLKMLMSDHKYTEALAVVQNCLKSHPKNKMLLETLFEIYHQLQDHEKLRKLTPKLINEGIIDKPTGEQCLLDNYLKELTIACNHSNTKEANKVWKSIPKSLQQTKDFLSPYCKFLVKQKETQTAEKLLKTTLNENLQQPELIDIYFKLPLQTEKLYAQGEKWLKKSPTNAHIQLQLGRQALKLNLWGQAINHFQQSLKTRFLPEAAAELIRLQSNLNNAEESNKVYHQLMQNILPTPLPELPQPTKNSSETFHQ